MLFNISDILLRLEMKVAQSPELKIEAKIESFWLPSPRKIRQEMGEMSDIKKHFGLYAISYIWSAVAELPPRLEVQ